jgi:hypothetical protein
MRSDLASSGPYHRYCDGNQLLSAPRKEEEGSIRLRVVWLVGGRRLGMVRTADDEEAADEVRVICLFIC